MKHKEQTSRSIYFNGLNLGFLLKVISLVTTLVASTSLALPSFFIFCVLQQSNRENFILGHKRKANTDTKIVQYLINHDEPNLPPTQRIQHIFNTLGKYYDKEFSDENGDEHRSSKQINKETFFLLSGRWVARALGWKGQMPDFQAINIEELCNKLNNGSDIAYHALLLYGLFPFEAKKIERALDFSHLPKSIWGASTAERDANVLIISALKNSCKTAIDSLATSLNVFSGNRFGFPYHFMATYSKNQLSVQLGSQYSFDIKLSNDSFKYMLRSQVILLPLYFYGTITTLSSLILLQLITGLTSIILSPESHLRFSLGYHPFTCKSELFFRNSTKDISYSVGTITMNILANLIAVSSLGLLCASNVMLNILSMRMTLTLFLITCVDRFLYISGYTFMAQKAPTIDLCTDEPMPLPRDLPVISISSPLISKAHSMVSSLCRLGVS